MQKFTSSHLTHTESLYLFPPRRLCLNSVWLFVCLSAACSNRFQWSSNLRDFRSLCYLSISLLINRNWFDIFSQKWLLLMLIESLRHRWILCVVLDASHESRFKSVDPLSKLTVATLAICGLPWIATGKKPDPSPSQRNPPRTKWLIHATHCHIEPL